jgi:hypothetical protein
VGDDKWARRKPGSASGTVVPPPAGDYLPPLPQRRGLVRSVFGRGSGEKDQQSSDTTASRPAVGDSASSRREANFSTHDSSEFPQNSGNGTPSPNLAGPGRQPSQENSRTQGNLRNSARSLGPELPDNVRQLFPPVLRSRKVLPATARALHPSAGKVQRPEAQSVAQQLPTTQDQPPSHAGGSAMRSAQGELLGHAEGRSTSLAAAWGTESAQSAATSRIWRRSRLRGTRQASLAGSGGRRQVLWMVLLSVLVIITGAGTLFALIRHPGGHGRGAQQGPTALSGAAAARASAARWVSSRVSRSDMIGCDTVMCADLLKAGVPSSDLLVLSSTAPDPLGADVLVATPLLQSHFGSRLRTEYAPTVLASFGRGPARVDVRLVANYGAAAYNLALRRDLAARRTVGRQLIGNRRIALPSTAENELAAGKVDSRLLITLPALAAKHPIRILAFFDRPPGASSGVPLAGVKLSGTDPKARMSPSAYLRWLTSFLRKQQSVYRAASVTAATHHGHRVVSVRFTWPSPIGLLH